MSTLEIKNLHAQVLPSDETAEPKPILKGVNLTIKSGETHAIMGPNGSGKSTLAYALSGHPRARAGRFVPRHAVPNRSSWRFLLELYALGSICRSR